MIASKVIRDPGIADEPAQVPVWQEQGGDDHHYRIARPRLQDKVLLAARRYLAMTAADVQVAFRKWVRPADFVRISEGPRRIRCVQRILAGNGKL
jgi:hypothetical protein